MAVEADRDTVEFTGIRTDDEVISVSFAEVDELEDLGVTIVGSKVVGVNSEGILVVDWSKLEDD